MQVDSDKNLVADDDDDGTVTKPEWKKKKVDDDERLSLRIDAIEAERWQAKVNKSPTTVKKTKVGKVSTKVKQLYDDEEDDYESDDDLEHTFRLLRKNQRADISNNDSSLLDALAPSERRMIEQRTHLETMKHQENAGRLNAIQQADTLARQAGLNRSQTADNMRQYDDAIYNPRRFRRQSLEQTIAKQTGIKGEILPKTESKVADGVKQIKDAVDNHKVKHVKIKDAKEIGNRVLNQNETAELILRKSGQTAKLSEIKKQSIIRTPLKEEKQDKKNKTMAKDFETSVNGDKKDQKSYDAQLKKVLRDSVAKSKKLRG